VDLESGDTTQRLPGPFVKTTPGALTFRRGAPRVGEHTKEVLSEWLSSDSAFWETSKADGNGGAMPLAGLKVLDFSWVVAGPMVGRTFADFGATVVRAESQAHLDTARRMKPYKNGEPGVERSSVYANCNAGKLGITLDLEQERARAIAHDLANWADVIVESYSPGVVARWGLDYESLSSHRRDLIMISSALNGQTGPMASLAGYGGTGASLSGYQGLAGWPDRLPIGPFGPYTDYLAPRFSLATLLAALDYRDRTGEGCYIDVSQIECGVFFLSPEMADYFTTGSVARPFGNNDPRYAPHGVYRTSSDDGTDHFVAVAVTTDEQWEALANLLAGPELAGDRRFRTGSARLEYREELDDLVGAWCATRDAASAEKLLQANGVPAHRSSSSYDFCEDEQLAHRHHLVRLPHPIFGETVVEGPRYQLNLTPGVVRRAAPTFGQDSEYVLTELLGYSESVAAELLSSGVLT
jgi:crotonobetainyl-CoA:carnitine CoA-transferase CaiB-like acyl-CoA transferase